MRNPIEDLKAANAASTRENGSGLSELKANHSQQLVVLTEYESRLTLATWADDIHAIALNMMDRLQSTDSPYVVGAIAKYGTVAADAAILQAEINSTAHQKRVEWRRMKLEDALEARVRLARVLSRKLSTIAHADDVLLKASLLNKRTKRPYYWHAEMGQLLGSTLKVLKQWAQLLYLIEQAGADESIEGQFETAMEEVLSG